jgi:ATP-binding cassette subfamily B protein
MSKWILSEVVQTSAMDCGPAALISLLDGFGISASYARLREACHTDLDGTSMDSLEYVARELGLDAELVLAPIDHVLLAKSVTSIAIVRMPGGYSHFIVVWRRHGRWVQVMDPGVGRRFMPREDLTRSLTVHLMPASIEDWRAYAEAPPFTNGLGSRLSRLGYSAGASHRAIDRAFALGGWRPIGALDAAARLVESLAAARAVRRGGEAVRLADRFFGRALDSDEGPNMAVPPPYWSVRPASNGASGPLLVRGTPVLRANGRQTAPPATERAAPRGPGLASAVGEGRARPWRELLRFVRVDGRTVPAVVLVGTLLAAAATILEALLLRAILNMTRYLQLVEQRIAIMLVVAAFVGVILLVEWQVAAAALRAGRRLETRLRLAWFGKLPLLPNRYFQSRLASDLAERGHAAAALRTAPPLAARLARLGAQIVVTVAAIAWLDRGSLLIAGAIALLSVALPIVANRVLIERDLRIQTHAGALSRFYLDALVGQIAIRAHCAERAIRRIHEELLTEWSRAGYGMQRAAVVVEGVTSFLALALSALLIVDHLRRAGAGGDVLLLAYWGLSLPGLGNEFAVASRQLPFLRNVALRSLDPILAPASPSVAPSCASERRARGVCLRLDKVTVLAGGHAILEDVDIEIAPGSHVAVVGASGAGKSSLVGVFLGWHRPSSGKVRVDGEDLTADALARLREETTWLDPAITLFNRPMLENISYAIDKPSAPEIARVVREAQLHDVVEILPDGLQTPLGEGGGLVSGGEGQRVRFARALARADARLVLLDEPFRGLDRERRVALLAAAREQWRLSTLLFVTHDVKETEAFDRVLVMERGCVVEDGRPADLGARPSRYRSMLEADASLRARLAAHDAWRCVRLEDGTLAAGGGSS